MSGIRRTHHRGRSSFVLIVIVASGVLATAGLAIAASHSIHVKVTSKAIVITGSRSAAAQVVQINYDPKKCASYAVEFHRSTQFSDIRGVKKGAFKYMIRRAELTLHKPLPHYVCVYLVTRKGNSFVQVAAASAKYP